MLKFYNRAAFLKAIKCPKMHVRDTVTLNYRFVYNYWD